MNISWSHAVIKVRDIDLMIQFYCDTLGFVVADRGPLFAAESSPEIAFLSGSSSDHHQLAFVTTRGPEEATSLEHAAFRTDSIAVLIVAVAPTTSNETSAPRPPVSSRTFAGTSSLLP